jgi:two-component system sensor histidine kinase PilS (NtrC family)
LLKYLKNKNDRQGYSKLKWLMFGRVVSSTVLLLTTLFLHFYIQQAKYYFLVYILYLLVTVIFLCSLLYSILLPSIRRVNTFTFIQIAIDSFFVSVIIFLSGGYFSMFSFLYLIVVIYASILLYLAGGLMLALLSSMQYALIVILQYYAVLPFFHVTNSIDADMDSILPVIYKILITSAAAFAMALLSGLLTEQNRKTRRELKAMETHVKRVEKMAYMGEMAAGLAHEIRNPLASLVGSIQLMKEEQGYNPDHQKLMNIILRETDRLSTLVNDFLFFARPPSGKPEQLNLKAIIEDIVSLFEKDNTHAKRCILRKKLAEDCWVIMDPAHFRQILWNLLLNAAEAIEDNGVIEIKTSKLKNHDISVQVSDNGCGMPADVVQSIFNPFYTTKSEGTGLGLSIVHRILEAYDGRLDVSSKEGEGTRFSLIIKQTVEAG